MEIGRIDSAESHAIVTAVIIEDGARRMGGIRINLANPAAIDEVYLEQDKLEVVKTALDEIARGVAVHATNRANTNSYFGAYEFGPAERNRPPRHALTAAYYFGTDPPGLSLVTGKPTFERMEYRFPGQQPEQLAELIARALEELKARDR